jgi:hypothetical protein
MENVLQHVVHGTLEEGKNFPMMDAVLTPKCPLPIPQQERYQKEQDKLKEEWEKAQKEVEEEERRYYEEVRSSQGEWEFVSVVLQSLAPPLVCSMCEHMAVSDSVPTAVSHHSL